MAAVQKITKMLEEISEQICNDYCKYTHSPVPEGKDPDWLWNDEDSPCNNCPLNRL